MFLRIFSLIMVLGVAAQAQVYTIPGSYSTIQAAIDGAPDGSLILVANGTYGYAQALNVAKRLYFKAAGGAGGAIISGGGTGRLLLIDSISVDSSRSLTFDGFVFENGVATGEYSPVLIAHARPTFINCTFRNNRSTIKGGAVLVYGNQARAYFLNCTFENNTSDRTAGAVLCGGAQPGAYFKDCTFRNNHNRTAAGDNYNEGGAIHVNDGFGRAVNTLFTGNSSAYAGGALMLLNYWTTPESTFDLWGCRFLDNYTTPIGGVAGVPQPSEGGAVMAESHVKVDIRGCFFSNNWAAAGGAVHSYRANMVIRDSVFEGNRAVGANYLGYGGAIGITMNDAGDADRREPELRLDNVMIRDSLAPVGGGLSAGGDFDHSKRGVLSLRNVVIENCRATTANNSYGNGGGLFFNLMQVGATNLWMINNEADAYGGAAAHVNNTILGMHQSYGVGNSASVDDLFHDPEHRGYSASQSVFAFNGGSSSLSTSVLAIIPPVTIKDRAWFSWLVSPITSSPVLTPPGLSLGGSSYSTGSESVGPYLSNTTFLLTSGRPARTGVVEATQYGMTNVAWSGIPSLPALVEAEQFNKLGVGASYRDQSDANEGGSFRTTDQVDVAPSAGASGGFLVGWIEPGEWLEYTVQSAGSSTYRLELVVAAAATGGLFYVQVDGQDVTGLVSVPNTGGWTTWQNLGVTNVTFTPGLHEVRVVMVRGGFNFDALQFVSSAPRLDVTPANLYRSVKVGANAVAQSIQVRNAGGSNMEWTASADAGWLEVQPDLGSSAGEVDNLSLTYANSTMPVGTYTGMVTVTYAEGATSRQVRVVLNIRSQGSYMLDFDGDGSSDLGVYYPPGGNWYAFRTSLGFWQTQFGYAGTVPVVGDFEGDGRADIGCYYAPGGNWYQFRSSNGFWQTQFGYAGTLPVVGDFDGDGKSDIGCYYPAGGNWYQFRSSNGFWQTQFGYAGTLPVVGDFDGDGKSDIGCFYPAGGNWYQYRSGSGFWETNGVGYAGTLPVVGDFDGDGLADIGYYDPPRGKWYLVQSSDGVRNETFGYAGTTPVVGDFDGDGKADIGCYYPPGGNWYYFGSQRGFVSDQFGYAGTLPLGGSTSP